MENFHNKRKWAIDIVRHVGIQTICNVVDSRGREVLCEVNIVVARQIVSEHNALVNIPAELVTDGTSVVSLKLAPQILEDGAYLDALVTKTQSAWLTTASIKKEVLSVKGISNQLNHTFRHEALVTSVERACAVVIKRWRDANLVGKNALN